MTTPRKNFNYNSPYAKPVQQYPSQSEDYISFDMGGPTKSHNKATSSNEKTPGRYNPKYYQQNYRNSNSKQNKRNLFNNNCGQQQYQTNNRQSFNQQHQTPRYRQKNNNERSQQKQNFQSATRENNSIASYIHPSMTEDPWFESMQRLQALERSKISFKATPSKDTNTPPPDTNSNSDSDNQDDEVDSVASD